MKRALILVTVLGLALTGCGKSRLNPFNWFQKRQSGEAVALYTPPVDSRGLVDRILSMQVDPATGGIILRATGLPPAQGYYDASLVKLDDPTVKPGRLVYEFRIKAPAPGAATGSQPSREVTVAVAISNYQLDGITAIEVRGAQNALSAHQ